ncbi:Acyl-CoA synthetase member 2 mitochondrial [Branchiostoma belcheri]|nr:Acyl-CoA synthetase member 2 mitochondrial [Branchiostoma belcheri]
MAYDLRDTLRHSSDGQRRNGRQIKTSFHVEGPTVEYSIPLPGFSKTQQTALGPRTALADEREQILASDFNPFFPEIKKTRVYGKDGPVHLTQSYHHGLDTTRLLGVTIGQKLQQTVQEFPDREMLVFKRGNVRRTFQQFFEECDQLAAGLVALGIRKGTGVNPAYQVNELAFALRKVGCRAVISATAFKTQDYYKMLHQICPELERCKAGQLEAEKASFTASGGTMSAFGRDTLGGGASASSVSRPNADVVPPEAVKLVIERTHDLTITAL